MFDHNFSWPWHVGCPRRHGSVQPPNLNEPQDTFKAVLTLTYLLCRSRTSERLGIMSNLSSEMNQKVVTHGYVARIVQDQKKGYFTMSHRTSITVFLPFLTP